MKLIVGLGNIGRKYEQTRHNVGFHVLDELAARQAAAPSKEKFDGRIAETTIAGEKILLLWPHTLMNRSGLSVGAAVDFYQLPLGDVLVVGDDFNLPLGKLRFRARGTHGGHNGLRDIQSHLGTNEYGRLRIGVGAPEEGEAVDHVLGKFRPSERPIMEESLARAVEGTVQWVREGIDRCMNQYNAG